MAWQDRLFRSVKAHMLRRNRAAAFKAQQQLADIVAKGKSASFIDSVHAGSLVGKQLNNAYKRQRLIGMTPKEATMVYAKPVLTYGVAPAAAAGIYYGAKNLMEDE